MDPNMINRHDKHREWYTLTSMKKRGHVIQNPETIKTQNNFQYRALDPRTMKHCSLSGASPPDPHAFGGTGFFASIEADGHPAQCHPNYVRYSFILSPPPVPQRLHR
jgi:hypothetical protein